MKQRPTDPHAEMERSVSFDELTDDRTPLVPPGPAAEGVTPEEEQEIRSHVRDRLLSEERAEHAREEERRVQRQRRIEAERLRWQVVEEETERFHRERGRVRYVSSSGQVLWLSPEDVRTRRMRRVRGRRRTGRRHTRTGSAITRHLQIAGLSLVVAWGIVILLATVIYLTEFA